jgi:hypothetical protein
MASLYGYVWRVTYTGPVLRNHTTRITVSEDTVTVRILGSLSAGDS